MDSRLQAAECPTDGRVAFRKLEPAAITRRTLLGRLACLGAFGCGPNSTRAASRESGPRQLEAGNALACRLSNYGEYQEAAWAHLRSIGIRHVFLNVPSASQVEPLQKRLAEHELTAVVMRGDADLSLPTGWDLLAPQLETCARMAVRYLFLSVKRRNVEKQLIYGRLRQAGDLAEKHDVTIVLETHPDLGTNGEVQRETMRQVAHPRVRVNFDTGNIHYYNRGTDAPTELKKIVEYVATVELKDHNGRFEDWHFPALGKGVVDFKTVLEILWDHGYTGPLTLEIEGIQGIRRSQQEIEKDIADSAAYVRSLGHFKSPTAGQASRLPR